MTDNAKELLALKPCPFCGGEARIIEGGESAYVQCMDVKMHRALWFTGDNNAANEVAEQWNRLSARQQASVEEIDQLLMGACSVNMTYEACQRQAERSRVALLAKYDIFEKVEG